ncbi:hypothetical protein [Streptomyces sp. TR06-5]|uniref:hypothetical protein n=1 Tax=Streptomyces sp. TR06-5 TaxID=3385976 RepID=UPI0039A13950
MHHIDPACLAAYSLGEEPGTLTAAQQRHLRACPACSARWRSLRRVVAAARAARPEDAVERPPHRVWHALLDSLASDSPATADTADTPGTADTPDTADTPGTPDTPDTPEPSDAAAVRPGDPAVRGRLPGERGEPPGA